MGKYQGRIAADVILGKDARIVSDGPLSPRVIFTDPQVAAVGHTLASAEQAGLKVRALDVETGRERRRELRRPQRARHVAARRRRRRRDRRRHVHRLRGGGVAARGDDRRRLRAAARAARPRRPVLPDPQRALAEARSRPTASSLVGMPETDTLLRDLFEGLSLTRAVLSKPRSRELPAKVTVDPVELRGETAYRFTTHLGDRATHENLAAGRRPRAARHAAGRLRAGAAADRRRRLAGARGDRAAAPAVPRRRAAGARPEEAVPARGGDAGAVPRRARRDDPGRQGAQEPLRQVPPGQPLPRAGRRRRAVAPPRGNAARGRLRLRQVVPHLRDPPSAHRPARPRGRDRRPRPEGGRDRQRAPRSRSAPAPPACASSAATSRASTRARTSTSSSACTPATPRPTRRSRRRSGGVRTRSWPSPAARRRRTGSSRARCSRRSCATGSRRSASPPSSPTRCARSCSSSPATARSWSSSSRSSTRRRTCSSARSRASRRAPTCAAPTRSCATRSGSTRRWSGCSRSLTSAA